MSDIVEIAKDLYWIGEKVSGLITKNSYLVKNGNEGILVDPGLYHKSIFVRARKKCPEIGIKAII